MKQRLHIIRGLPGSGKTELGERLTPGQVFSADDYFMDKGVYRFAHDKLPEAHADCKARVSRALRAGKTCSVANTFVQEWEYLPYIRLALRVRCDYQLISLFNPRETPRILFGRCTHNVPLSVIESMCARWEHA